ncbi:MAG: tetratricopeptide repeat protein [Acidobacteria bacterium]|nr:tetratricopeptide repeat protein [Acidobacteriota bacterium]
MTNDREKLEQLKELAGLEPDDPVVHYGLGSEHLRLGEFAEAAAALRRTLELKPDYSAAYRELGKALEKLGEREQAIAAYQKGREVACAKGDLQTSREIEVFLKRLGAT